MSDLTFAQEFSIEIPDKEADGILSSMFSRWKMRLHGYAGADFLTVDKAVNYILGQPDGKLPETI